MEKVLDLQELIKEAQGKTDTEVADMIENKLSKTDGEVVPILGISDDFTNLHIYVSDTSLMSDDEDIPISPITVQSNPSPRRYERYMEILPNSILDW